MVSIQRVLSIICIESFDENEPRHGVGSRTLITGLRGTVAPVVAERLRQQGNKIIAWDRDEVPETQLGASAAFLAQSNPDKVFHIGLGPPAWAAVMAAWCKNHDRRFVFTSTASVFSINTKGPFTVEDTPDAADDYGAAKYACEQAITYVNPDALIVRLGWQIGHQAGNNNMFDFFERESRQGRLVLSENWFPACSFLEDTATTLVDLEQQGACGLFLLDGNPGLSIYEIGKRVSRLHNNRWQVSPKSEPDYNTLMRDDRVTVPSITDQLK